MPNESPRKRGVGFLSRVAGLVCLLLGMLMIAAYAWTAIVQRWGEPDQSLLFWYLPLLLFGLILVFRIGLPLLRYAKHSRAPPSGG